MICFGSEVFPRTEYEKWRAAYPSASFVNLYGPTEATGMSCYWIAERELDEGESIPIGRPFRNTEIMLIGEDGERAENGEIYIRGSALTLGYLGENVGSSAFLRDPTNSLYFERVYRTGDIGRINEHGELVFVCRRDMQIKHMGHRIELGEIEAAAIGCGADRACAVYDAEARKITLIFTGKSDKDELLRSLKERLPHYALPARALRLDAMPQTANGKLDRRLLAEMAKKS
jgi:acyl-CoA synthetase (AMP-forming)/AMP-acid ligase II